MGRLLRFPEQPDLPPFLSGQSYVVVEAASTLPAESTDALLEPLRALGPSFDTFDVTRIEDLGLLHMDPPAPVPCAGDGFLPDQVPDDAAVDALLAVAGPDVDSPLLTVELRQLGGALTPGRAEHGGAVDGLPAQFLGFAVGLTPDAGSLAAVHAATTAVQHALAPWSTDRCYLNFAERRKPSSAIFGEPTLARLRAIKKAYDPADLIRSNQPVAPVQP